MTLNSLLTFLNLAEDAPKYTVLPSVHMAQERLSDGMAGIFVEFEDGTEVHLKFGSQEPK